MDEGDSHSLFGLAQFIPHYSNTFAVGTGVKLKGESVMFGLEYAGVGMCAVPKTGHQEVVSLHTL